MGSEIPLPGGKKITSIVNWMCLPDPRRKFVVFYMVFSLVMAISTVVLPTSFYWLHLGWSDYELNILWIWGRTDLSGHFYPFSSNESLTTSFATAGYFFIITNVIFYIMFKRVNWRYLVLTSHLFLISTWAWVAGFAGSSMIYGRGMPGGISVVVLAGVCVMSYMFKYIPPSSSETRDLLQRFAELGSGIAAYLVSKDEDALNSQFRKLAEDAIACGAYDIHGQTRQYRKQVSTISSIYHGFSSQQPVTLSNLRFVLNMSESASSQFILSLLKAFDGEIVSDRMMLKHPIDEGLFVRTVKKLLDECSTNSSPSTSDTLLSIQLR